MTIGIVESVRNSMADFITFETDDFGSASLKIYDGVRPSTGGAATTVLADLTLSFPSFPAASGGVITANAITGDTSANNTGTATWFRITDGSSGFVMDGDVGTSGSDLNLNTVAITTGVQVDITSFVITIGNP